MGFLTPRALAGLADYKFKPGGYTWLDVMHQPVWNYVTERLPLWLAPNLITLAGLCGLLASYAASAVAHPDFGAGSPRWLCALCAAAVFFYLHADCLDGKQARRTRTSSPLGQLFDHGCDALAVHLVLNALMVALQVDARSPWAVAGQLYVYGPWLAAHWEEYHTGAMVYGNGVWGVTEANYAVVAICGATAAVGPRLWLGRPLAPLLAHRAVAPLAAVLPKRLVAAAAAAPTYVVTLAVFGALGAGMFAEQVARVFRLAGSAQVAATTLPPSERGAKQLGRAAAAAHLAQLALMHALGGLVLALPAPRAGQVRMYYAAFGVAYALNATRLVVAHMAKEPFSVAAWPLAVLAALAANGAAGAPAPAAPLAAAGAAALLGGYLWYVVSVVREICAFLGISALTIPPGGYAPAAGGGRKGGAAAAGAAAGAAVRRSSRGRRA